MGAWEGGWGEGRGTRDEEEGRGTRRKKKGEIFFVPPFFRVSSFSSLLALSSLPSVAPRSRRKGGRDEQWKQHRGRRRRPAATATTTATARDSTGRDRGAPVPPPAANNHHRLEKKNRDNTHHFLLLDLLVERGLAVRGEARAGQGDVGGLGELGNVGELGLDLEGVESEWRKRGKRVSGGERAS